MNEGIPINKVAKRPSVQSSSIQNIPYSTTFTMSLNVDDAYDSEYFHDMDGSDEPEEDEVDGPGIPEEENAPRLTTEEVNILKEYLEEWATLKGDRRRPVTQRARQRIKDLPDNEYIDVVEWNTKKEVSNIQFNLHSQHVLTRVVGHQRLVAEPQL